MTSLTDPHNSPDFPDFPDFPSHHPPSVPSASTVVCPPPLADPFFSNTAHSDMCSVIPQPHPSHIDGEQTLNNVIGQLTDIATPNDKEIAIRLQRLKEVDLPSVIKRSVFLAYHLMRNHSHLPCHLSPEDYVYNCLSKLISGENAWPRDIPLTRVLFYTIKRDIHHAFLSQHNILTNTDDYEELVAVTQKVVPFDHSRSDIKTPEQHAIEASQINDFLDFVKRNDATLLNFTTLLLSGISFQDIASSLGVDINVCRNMSKRLRRLVKKYGGIR